MKSPVAIVNILNPVYFMGEQSGNGKRVAPLVLFDEDEDDYNPHGYSTKRDEFDFLDDLFDEKEKQVADSSGNMATTEGTGDDEEGEDIQDLSIHNRNFQSHWNLSRFWPAILGQHFEQIVMIFLEKHRQYRHDACDLVVTATRD